MRRVVICTPVYGNPPFEYMHSLCGFLRKLTEVQLDVTFVRATYVEQARDQLVESALKMGATDILWWDLDVAHHNQEVMLAMVRRLLSHNVPIACAQYTTHTLKSNFLGNKSPGAVPNERGLLKMDLAPIGLSVIKTDVYRVIREKFPERTYTAKEPTMAPKYVYQYHRNGLVGPNTAGGKMERIKEIVRATNWDDHAQALGGAANIRAIINDADYSKTVFVGEDYDFCFLARAAGFEILMDTNIIVPHLTTTGYPISNRDVMTMVGEEWRNLEPKALREIADKLERQEVA